MSEAGPVSGDILAFRSESEHSQFHSDENDNTVRSLQSEIDYHRKHDKRDTYLSSALGTLTSNDEESLKELEQLAADARKAVASGDKRALEQINTSSKDAIRHDRELLNMKDEIDHYGGGFLKTMSLFLKGRFAMAGLMLTAALDQAKPSDNISAQIQDFSLGAAKGLLTKATMHALGQAKLGIAAQGIGLGTTTRLTELGLDRSTYINHDTGRFDLALGASRAAGKALSPAALICDVAMFGAAHSMIAGGNQLTRDAIRRSPLLSTMLTGTTFGFASGATTEVTRQSDRGERFDLGKILMRGALQGAIDTVSAVPGGIQADVSLCSRIDLTVEKSLPKVLNTGKQIRQEIDETISNLFQKFPPGGSSSHRLSLAPAASLEIGNQSFKPSETLPIDFMMQAAVETDTTLISDHREALSARSLNAEEYIELKEENQRCREQIIDSELELVAKQPIDAERLEELKSAQLELLDDIANCQLEILCEKRQENIPLSFEQARQEKQLIELARNGLNYLSDLKQVRKLDATESLIATKLSEQLANYDQRQLQISTILGHSSTDAGLAEKLRGARQRLHNDLEEMGHGEPTETLLIRNAQDLELVKDRRAELRNKIDRLSALEVSELKVLDELFIQGIEARTRRHIFWGPARMDDARGQLLPAFLRSQDGSTGRFAERKMPEFLKDVLDEQRIANPESGGADDRSKFTKELSLLSKLQAGPRRDALLIRLGVDRSELSSKSASILYFEFLDPQNWKGVPVPDGSAADHAKADYILFNKRTGHYFVLDFTTAVGQESQDLLGNELIKTGKEVVLGGSKLKASADRTAFLIVIDPNLDYSSSAAINRLREGLAKILVHKIIGTEQPFNCCRQPLPSSMPSKSAIEKISDLKAFEKSLREVGFTGWADELGRITYL